MRKISLRLKHLSQEHQAAMRLAVSARVAALDLADLPALSRRIAQTFERELEPHFLEEERHAIPQLRELGRNDLAERTLREHMQIRAIVKQLHEAPSPEHIKAFSEALSAHVEFEEGEVWEVLEAAAERSN
ncbi:hemerythrin domain-containing protein [Uliginosibacterium sp. H1]|uniref:hemerythrin domain-containing protein n=1 Tax=Uliginosibacterium sp. H1 TaxID=3114757 RepID=UPI002E18AFED|nr:hemerythrin domain-containing protein [Uliginosibacterium sp. H1]